MQAEIVITGLCSILNPTGTNPHMGDPSFIAVQTDHRRDHAQSHDHPHITYIAFDSSVVQVDDATGFKKVTYANQFLYLPLDGHEISIDGVMKGVPELDQSYLHVVRRDDYWPEAKDKFNRDYVPKNGAKPKKTAVTAWMRFGGGVISAGRISRVLWEFTRADGTKHIGNFAEEVVYSDFLPSSAEELAIVLNDLDAEDSSRAHTLRFTPRVTDGAVTVIIGNNTKADMPAAVKRLITTGWKTDGKHFKYLNAVADPSYGTGPVPVPRKSGLRGTTGGGENSGPCGPGSGNN